MATKADTTNTLKALCLEDSPRDVEIMRELLRDAGFDLDMDCTAVEKEFVSLLRSKTYDIILADFKLPGFDAFAALHWTMEICPNVPFICVSGSIGEETAVEILKQGAVDYVLKDRLAKLPSAVKRALEGAREKEGRRRVEEKLQRSEKRLREAQEMAHLGFWNWDVKTGEVEWSEEVFKIFCLDSKEFTPHIDSILALSPWPEDHHRDQELIKKAIETHTPGSYEQKFLRPDQSIGYYYSTFQGNFDEKGDLISMVGTVHDITGRKRAEEVIKRSQDLIIETQRIAKLGGWEYDTATRCVTWTDEVYHIYGVSSDYDPSHPEDDIQFYAPEDQKKIADAFQRSVELGEPYDLELQLINAQGEKLWIRTVGQVERKEGKIIRVFGNIMDITERKHTEEKILHQLEELKRWQEVTLGREDRIRQLKHEVNELLNRAGETNRYPSQEGDVPKDHPNEVL